MGTIKVSIDAEAAGKQSKFNFAWEGDDEEINEVIGFVAERADEAGISPEALGQSTLFHLPRTGVYDDPGTRRSQMMFILDAVLRMPIGDEHSGTLVRDVASRQDIVAELTIRNGALRGKLHGQPRAN